MNRKCPWRAHSPSPSLSPLPPPSQTTTLPLTRPPSPSFSSLSSPSVPRCASPSPYTQPQTLYLSYQHLIFSSFSTTSMFHPLIHLSPLYSVFSPTSPLLFSSYSSLSIRPQLSPECLPAWMVTIVLLLAVGMKLGLLYKPGDGLRNG